MLKPTETYGREDCIFFLLFLTLQCCSSPRGLWHLCMCVCACVLTCLDEKKNSGVNGDVTVRLWPPHESAPEGPYWQLMCARWVRQPVGGPPAPPASPPCSRDWSSAGHRSIFHPFHTMEAVSSATHMFPIRCVFILPHEVLSRGSLSSPRYWK